MLKYENFLAESLAAEIKSEPKSAAAKEARRLGLNYMGFGRYADNQGKIAYIVDNDRLVPFKSSKDISSMYSKSLAAPTQEKEKTNTDVKFYNDALNRRTKEDDRILRQKGKENNALAKELNNLYKPNMFSQEEIQALQYYTSDGYEVINKYLYKGYEPNTTEDQANQIEATVNALDSAFEGTQAPFAYTVYAGLSSRYSPDKINSGGEYIFRGYLSTSLDFNTAIGISNTDSRNGSVVLQIEVSKGQKSIYADSLSANAGERETLLPRGSRIKVISGPHLMDYSIINPDANEMQISLFHCELMEDL